MQPSRRPNLNAHKDFLRSQSVIRKRRKKTARRLAFRAVLFVLLVGALLYATRLEQFAVQKVVVVGTADAASADISQKAEAVLGQSYFGIIPKSDFLFYPKRQITVSILKDHPELAAVQMGTENIHTLNIRVIERKPAALWCQQDACYTMDDKAYVYALAASSTFADTSSEIGGNGKLLSIYDTVATSTDPVGTEALLPTTFSDMLSVAAELSSSSLPVENISIAEDGQYIFKISGNGKILFSDKKPFQESYQDLISALQSPVFATSGAFQYIDTRFGNKVFYRLGKESSSDSATSSPLESATSTLKATSSAKAR